MYVPPTVCVDLFHGSETECLKCEVALDRNQWQALTYHRAAMQTNPVSNQKHILYTEQLKYCIVITHSSANTKVNSIVI